MAKTPVLFIVFNRPDTTQKVFDAIRKAQPSKLFIAADGPRKNKEGEEERCRRVRTIVSEVDWPCEVSTLYRDKNLGCGLAVSGALNWFFEHNEEGIILEDDCVPHPDFFTFCSEMLEYYRHNDKIISISGCNLGYRFNINKSYAYSRFMNMWGWATWRRATVKIDYRMEDWKQQKNKLFTTYRLLRQNVFDGDINWYKLWREKFDKVSADRNFTWDWQWSYYQLGHKLLSVVPAKNLVTNIGFHNEATHTLAENNPSANIPAVAMEFPLVHPDKIIPDFGYEEKAVKYTWCYHRRMPLKNYLMNRVLDYLH
ncbi:MAG: glycosyltransferase family 2 protein [Chitinophagaceae bacterium]|nr:glycosyltransferase family 2 protein [Chitinophagaceae bacterium]MCZ2397311.1 glycosyltransferase family 2 protein [Chitinophagales bacterium]